MAHKNKTYSDLDNSRPAYHWRKKNNKVTKADKEREEIKNNVDPQSKLKALIESGEIKTKLKRKGNQVNLRKH